MLKKKEKKKRERVIHNICIEPSWHWHPLRTKKQKINLQTQGQIAEKGKFWTFKALFKIKVLVPVINEENSLPEQLLLASSFTV